MLVKRKITMEIEVPDDFDPCWNDGTGIQAFHETVWMAIQVDIMKRTAVISKLDTDSNFLKTKLAVLESAKYIV